jgi:magnesium-transporting ATPase (P-type)
MITGDNTLTGSNISYKCDISSRGKGMIICDYVNGKFTEEGFDFQEDDDNTTDVSSKNQQLPPLRGHDVAVHNSFSPKKGLEIELYMDNTTGQNLNTASEAVQSEAKAFMQEMLHKADKRNCQLCVTGRAFNEMFSGNMSDLSELEKSFMRTVSVFARTKPNDKAKIVMAFQHMDLKVSMCGDGANDCGALKQADIGLSLSQAEASISAPFTSQVPNITSMVEVIKECRAGLATNFSLFNILTIYSLIQYTTTVLTQKFLQYPADFQYLYWDLFLNFSFIVFIGYTKTA